MEDVVLIVTEGKNPEFELVEQLKSLFFPSSKRTVVRAYWHSNLLGLCRKLDNETLPKGRLFISYPMVESLWDVHEPCSNHSSCFTELTGMKRYKEKISLHKEDNPNVENYAFLLAEHSKRAYFMSCGNAEDISLDSLLSIDGVAIHERQVGIFLERNRVFSLSPIPLFLLSIDKGMFDQMLPYLSNGCGCECLL